MSEAAAAIRVDGLSKKFRLFASPRDRLKEALHPFGKSYHRDFWALKGVSFEIPKGQSVGILGRNGSGKSTLLRILASVLPPTHGAVRVEGRIAALLELGAGFHPEFTGRENAILQGTIFGYSRAEIERLLPGIEAFANIGSFFDQPVKIYSSGMFLRVAFSTAINVDPDILIIDEALAVGDVRFTVRCVERLLELRDRGVTILLVSHYPELIVRLCQRGIILDHGRLIFSGPAREAADRYYEVMFSDGLPAAGEILHERQEPLPAPGAPPPPPPPQPEDAFQAFVAESVEGDNCVTRRSYNVEERRVDSGRAVIVDFRVTVDGDADAVRIKPGAVLEVFVKAKALSPIATPVFGYTVWSASSIRIAGSNSHINPACFEIRAEPPFYSCRFRLLNRMGEDNYFLDIGFVELAGATYTMLQTRQRMIHMVAEPTPWFQGAADLGLPL
jgi:lipopolysaccharide transport system ATP-binding protein